MSLQMYILAILVLLLILSALLHHTFRLIHWFPATRFISHLKSPTKRALLLVQESKKCLRYLNKEFNQTVKNHPENAEAIANKMKELLPIDTVYSGERQRVNQRVRKFQKALFNDAQENKGPQSRSHISRKKNVKNQTTRFNIMIQIHSMQDNLDCKAGKLKAQINTLLKLARKYSAAGHYSKLKNCLKIAEKLQQRNIRLIKDVHKVERKLVGILRKIKKS